MVVVPNYVIRYRGKCVPPGSRVDVDEKTGKLLVSGMLAKPAADAKSKQK